MLRINLEKITHARSSTSLHGPMCSLVSIVLNRLMADAASLDAALVNDMPDRRTSRPELQTDDKLATVLHAFFQKRLQDGEAALHLGHVPLLVLRTLNRLACHRVEERGVDREDCRSHSQKGEVLRAALMELHRLDVPVFPRRDSRASTVHPNK